MGYGYSVDLRERAVAYYDNNSKATEAETAHVFGVGEATIRRWRRLKRENGSIDPRPRGGGNPARVGPDDEELLVRIVQDHADRTIAEIAEKFAEAAQKPISSSAMSRALIRLGLTRKKKPFAPRSK